MLDSVLHLFLTSDLDLDAWKAESDRDEHPHHLIGELRDAFTAVAHRPVSDPKLVDRLAARVCTSAGQWALARRTSAELGADDVVFSFSEDQAVALVCWLRLRRSKAVVISSVMNPGRLRMKALFRLVGMKRRVARFVALTPVVEQILRDEHGIPAERVERFPLETDFDFFHPVERTRVSDRPLVFSAGLEQRDYTTLAEAVRDLDLDAEVCATSPDASARTRMSIPDVLPPNVTFAPYAWLDYRRMFSEADVVVVSVLPNRYGAGLTTMVEGLACGRPVIVTDTGGLPAELAAAGALVVVPPGDPAALRDAIARIVADPGAAAELARIGREVALERFATRCAIETLDRIVRSIAPHAARRRA